MAVWHWVRPGWPGGLVNWSDKSLINLLPGVESKRWLSAVSLLITFGKSLY